MDEFTADERRSATKLAEHLETRSLRATPLPGVTAVEAAQAAHSWTQGYRFAIRILRELAIDPDDIPDDIREIEP